VIPVSSSSSSSLSGGAIAGIVIGSVVGAILICALFVCICCSGGLSKKSEKKSQGSERHQDQATHSFEQVEESQQGEHRTGEVEMETA